MYVVSLKRLRVGCVFAVLNWTLTCLVPQLAFADNLQQSDFGARVDISYTEANPDYSLFENGEGVSVYGRFSHLSGGFAFLRYTDAAFRPSGSVTGGEVKDWRELGLGYRYLLSEEWAVETNVSHQEHERNGGKVSGHQLQLGAEYLANESLSLGLHLGKLDLLIDDWTLMFEAAYGLSDSIYAVARLRDYADWDFTYYEAGLGLRF